MKMDTQNTKGRNNGLSMGEKSISNNCLLQKEDRSQENSLRLHLKELQIEKTTKVQK